jgi:hypothetical protein
MSRLIRVLAILTASLVLAVPWIWIFTLEIFAIAVIFDCTILSVLLLINDDRNENIRKNAEHDRKLNLATTAPVKMLKTSMDTHEQAVECAKCGLVITPSMVKKQLGFLFYHLNCTPPSESPQLGV